MPYVQRPAQVLAAIPVACQQHKQQSCKQQSCKQQPAASQARSAAHLAQGGSGDGILRELCEHVGNLLAQAGLDDVERGGAVKGRHVVLQLLQLLDELLQGGGQQGGK
jgi:hypothetical protein